MTNHRVQAEMEGAGSRIRYDRLKNGGGSGGLIFEGLSGPWGMLGMFNVCLKVGEFGQKASLGKCL